MTIENKVTELLEEVIKIPKEYLTRDCIDKPRDSIDKSDIETSYGKRIRYRTNELLFQKVTYTSSPGNFDYRLKIVNGTKIIFDSEEDIPTIESENERNIIKAKMTIYFATLERGYHKFETDLKEKRIKESKIKETLRKRKEQQEKEQKLELKLSSAIEIIAKIKP